MAGGRARMSKQYGVGVKRHRLCDDRLHRHRTEFPIDQPDFVAVVDQGTSDRQQAERRQMIVGNAAADRWMRHVDEENAHRWALLLQTRNVCGSDRLRQAAKSALAAMKAAQRFGE